MDSVADILERGAKLIEPEGTWCQGELGLDDLGNPVSPARLNQAVCFCVSGAIYAAGGDYLPDGWWRPVKELIRWRSIPEWNDAPGRTQAEAIALLHKAAAKAREQGVG